MKAIFHTHSLTGLFSKSTLKLQFETLHMYITDSQLKE